MTDVMYNLYIINEHSYKCSLASIKKVQTRSKIPLIIKVRQIRRDSCNKP